FFPEMQRFPSDSHRHAAWRKACSRNYPILWNNKTVMNALGFLVILALPVLVYVLVIRQFVPGLQWLVNILVFSIISGISLWATRNHITRILRQELNAAGIATCIKCGYDLRTCTENRCSECGTTISPISG